MPVYAFGRSGDVTLIKHFVTVIIKGVGKGNFYVKEVYREYEIYTLWVLPND